VTSAARVPGRNAIAQGSLKLAISLTVKGASASGVAGCAPDASSLAMSAGAASVDCRGGRAGGDGKRSDQGV
jgi:hypothetical protein